MDIVIDHARGFALSQAPEDILGAVAAVSDHLRAQGRAILSIRADGHSVTPGALVAAFEGKPLSEVNELAFTSDLIGVLVDNCLRELEEVLPELPVVCHRLAEVFQSESPNTGFEPFEQLAAIWKTIKEREIQILNALDLDTATMLIDGVAVDVMHRELNAFIDEAAQALQHKDCVLLGDLLEYELAPRAETEASFVALLRERARETAS